MQTPKTKTRNSGSLVYGLKPGTIYYCNELGLPVRLVSVYASTDATGNETVSCTVKNHGEVWEDVAADSLDFANSYFVKKYFAKK